MPVFSISSFCIFNKIFLPLSEIDLSLSSSLLYPVFITFPPVNKEASLFKVLSGSINTGDDVKNINQSSVEKFRQDFFYSWTNYLRYRHKR